MGRGSVLKNLKSELQSNDLLRHQKHKKGDKQQAELRKQRDERNLSAIREAFNPFNAKFDNRKSTGAPEGKSVAGRPVAARSAAEAQRRRAWEAEKKLKNKIGGMVDRRFGEKDKSMSEEDKMVERFAREKVNNLRKLGSRKSFNIEDDDQFDNFASNEDILTHGGQALSFNDDFAEDDLGVDSDDDGQPQKKRARLLDQPASLGESGNDSMAAEPEAPSRPKTKAEVMQEIIAKSKMHKHERQMQRQADDELVENLNEDFDGLMADLALAEEQQKAEKRNVDRYDIDLQELAFEKRADPSERSKTEEELAKEAADKKRAAEQAKTARMEGDELDIEVDGAQDDANLFGLEDRSDEDDNTGRGADEMDEAEAEAAAEAAASQQNAYVPDTLSGLQKSLAQVADVGEKLQYFIKLAMPGRGSGSKTQLQKLSVAMLKFSLISPPNFEVVIKLLHEAAAKHDVGLTLANECRDLVHSAKRKPSWGVREALLFSLIGSLFSTSDQWHVVATSASLAITQRLSQSTDTDLAVVATNFFLCDLLLTFQRLSKRYIPEVSGYVLRVLAMVPSTGNIEVAERSVRLSTSQFTLKEYQAAMLVLGGVEGKIKLGQAPDLANVLVVAAKIISKAASLWRSLESFPEVFGALNTCLKAVSHENNKIITETVSKVDRLVHFSSSERKFLELQQFRPVGIITHAPLFDENYNPEIKGSQMDPEQRELQKLKALHKKERKSTLREIRRDAEFESRQNLDEKRREMAEYHNKLRRLEGQINGDEGAERNAYEREKQKRRRH